MLDANRLEILTESAKYDVSCSSSGSRRKNTESGIGNAYASGICHSFTPDGRCISLLKILMSNDCVYDCEYCPNRRSADVPRASNYPRRDLRAGYKFLQAKLYRRVVFIFGGVRVARQDDGAFMRDSYKAEKTL